MGIVTTAAPQTEDKDKGTAAAAPRDSLVLLPGDEVENVLRSPLPIIQDLLDVVGEYLPPESLPQVRAAYDFAAEHHEGALRRSGEPYVVHPLTTALILAEMRLDLATIIAGLLHDVVEDTGATLEQVETRFGRTVARIVDGVTKVAEYGRRQVEWVEGNAGPDGERRRSRERLIKQQAENIKKMLLAMAEDPRVVIVKLADRLHNMRTLDALAPHKQQRKALETREIYAPLAGRLGMGQLKAALEDLAFKYLEPDAYEWLLEQLAEQRTRRENFIERAAERLREELADSGISADVYGRTKHLYSIYLKLQRVDMNLSRIFDLYALRVILDGEPRDCWPIVGIVHNLWPSVEGRVKDYISRPKPNGYQSLHTTVIGEGGRPMEVQIRTRAMHQLAEYGVATHWYYKEQGSTAAVPPSLTDWIKALVSLQEDESKSNATELVDTLKLDVFQDQVFVLSPKGDILDLPARSTPIDFAYRIHTELGHRTIGARVNDRMVPLDHQLHNGDRVEILTTKLANGPGRDWLNFVVTSSAREKIRGWFKRQHREENIVRGRELLDHDLQRLEQRTLSSIAPDVLMAAANALEYKNLEDLYAAIGYGAASAQQVITRLHLREEATDLILPAEVTTPGGKVDTRIEVMGVGDLLTRLATCCHAAPGDPIIGYITRNRGVTVHRATCPRILSETEKERLVQVNWGRAQSLATYEVPIYVQALDREGLLRDVSTAVAEERVNIVAASVNSAGGTNMATIRATLNIASIDQLSRVFARIERVRGVIEVSRDLGRKSQTA
ncbi:MAG: bifunctional (p)ppGpp synthetase/guanosine-3',5'-bis(diphosphate) 3'-pyrophosphohydrolase [Chloroflexota bacterium]